MANAAAARSAVMIKLTHADYPAEQQWRRDPAPMDELKDGTATIVIK